MAISTTCIRLLAVGLILSSPAALAGPAADALGLCLTDNTTGKDRKSLAAWVFVAMAAHPDVSRFAIVPESGKDEQDKATGALVTRLITESCVSEARVAISTEGSDSFVTAFEILGKMAMQEIMSDPKVSASIEGFQKYLDQKKFEAAFSSE